MEKTRIRCQEIATRIYELDKNIYKCVGSRLGRVITGGRRRSIDEMTETLFISPGDYGLRTDIVLIGNMARTIEDKEERSKMLHEYNEILEEIYALPDFGDSSDILNEKMAALNLSNLKRDITNEDHLVICISRMHGSGGSDIGFKLAEQLKISYYDDEIFKQVLKRLDAEKDRDYMLNHGKATEEGMENYSGTFTLKKKIADFQRYHGLSPRDAIFFNQSDLLCDMAKKEDFVVIGRCADQVMTNNYVPHISIFITAPFELRVQRLMKISGLDDYKKAARVLKKLDRKSSNYYEFYTGKKRGNAGNYDLCINSANYGIQESVELIKRTMNLLPNKAERAQEVYGEVKRTGNTNEHK